LFDTASTVHEGILDIVLEDVLDFAPSPVPSLPTASGDKLMRDEMAYLKRKANVIVDELYVDRDL
jgi:hypothetical protein